MTKGRKAHKPHRFRRDAALVRAACEVVKHLLHSGSDCPVCGASTVEQHKDGCAFAIMVMRYHDYRHDDGKLADFMMRLTWSYNLRVRTKPQRLPLGWIPGGPHGPEALRRQAAKLLERKEN